MPNLDTLCPGATERAMLARLLAVRPTGPAPGGTDWQAVLDYTGGALSPLVLHGIQQGRAGTDPARWVLQQLYERTRTLAALQTRKQHGLREVCQALAAASIPTLLLKGAALAQTVYPQPWLRPTRDLDLWVAPRHLENAAATLAALSFAHPADHALHRTITRSPVRRILESAERRLRVELHTRPPSLADLDWARFDVAFEAGIPLTVGGIEVRMLAPEHQLAHLCLHLGRAHAFDLTLLHVVDIALVVERWRELWDWPTLTTDWRRQRVGTWIALALSIARDLLGVAIPDDIDRRVRSSDTWQAMRALTERRLWAHRSGRLPGPVTNAIRQPSPRQRIRWLKRRLVDFYWHEPEARDLLDRVRSASRKFWYDVRVKVPRYVSAWRQGAFTGRALADGLARERDRAELEALVVAGGDLGYVDESEGQPRPADPRYCRGSGALIT